MSNIPSDLKYAKSHEWLRVSGDTATVGITDYAQAQLGDIVFVELPALGANIEKGGEAAVVESVKAASDVFAPVTGTISEVNAALEEDPALVNSAPETGGWFFKLALADPSELEGLMDAAEYKAFCVSL